MKHNLVVLSAMALFTLSAISCSKSSTDKKENAAIPEVASYRLPDPCPRGTHPVLVYEFDSFHFHRPKFSCQSGFWFCTKGGSWSIECVTDAYRASIDGTTAIIWARELANGQMEIHFPLAIKNDSRYSTTDLQTFNVDDEWEIYTGITLKIGDYAVTETADELVVVVDTL